MTATKKTSTKKTTATKTSTKTAAKKHSGFEKGSGCYTCKSCGKQTRAGADGDPSAVNVGLCTTCWEKAGDENAVMDGQLSQEEFNKRWGVNENFLNEGKPDFINDNPVQPTVTDIGDEDEIINIHAEAEKIANLPDPEAPVVKAETPAEKPAKEKLAAKIRRVGDIKRLLIAGAHILQDEKGLMRLEEENGTIHPVSKRRVKSLIEQEFAIPLAAGMSTGFVGIWHYNVNFPALQEAEKAEKAAKKTPAAAPAATSETKEDAK